MERRRRADLDRTIDAIRQRLGNGAIQRGSRMDREAVAEGPEG
jgi:hypothetical protein